MGKREDGVGGKVENHSSGKVLGDENGGDWEIGHHFLHQWVHLLGPGFTTGTHHGNDHDGSKGLQPTVWVDGGKVGEPGVTLVGEPVDRVSGHLTQSLEEPVGHWQLQDREKLVGHVDIMGLHDLLSGGSSFHLFLLVGGVLHVGETLVEFWLDLTHFGGVGGCLDVEWHHEHTDPHGGRYDGSPPGQARVHVGGFQDAFNGGRRAPTVSKANRVEVPDLVGGKRRESVTSGFRKGVKVWESGLDVTGCTG